MAVQRLLQHRRTPLVENGAQDARSAPDDHDIVHEAAEGLGRLEPDKAGPDDQGPAHPSSRVGFCGCLDGRAANALGLIERPELEHVAPAVQSPDGRQDGSAAGGDQARLVRNGVPVLQYRPVGPGVQLDGLEGGAEQRLDGAGFEEAGILEAYQVLGDLAFHQMRYEGASVRRMRLVAHDEHAAPRVRGADMLCSGHARCRASDDQVIGLAVCHDQRSSLST